MDDLSPDLKTIAREQFQQKVRQKLEGKLEQMTDLLIEVPAEAFFGETEFQLRDLVHQLTLEVTEEAIEARKKTKQNRTA